MFWWVVTPILAFYLKMSTGVPIDRISHHCTLYTYICSDWLRKASISHETFGPPGVYV